MEIKKKINQLSNPEKSIFLDGALSIALILKDDLIKKLSVLKKDFKEQEYQYNEGKEDIVNGYPYLRGGEICDNITTVGEQNYIIANVMSHLKNNIVELEYILSLIKPSEPDNSELPF